MSFEYTGSNVDREKVDVKHPAVDEANHPARRSAFVGSRKNTAARRVRSKPDSSSSVAGKGRASKSPIRREVDVAYHHVL
jgi:hypothetical protein